jgi:hypothetical protein
MLLVQYCIVSLVSADQAVLSQKKLPEITAAPVDRRPATAPARVRGAGTTPTRAARAPHLSHPSRFSVRGSPRRDRPVCSRHGGHDRGARTREHARRPAAQQAGITGSFCARLVEPPVIRGLDVNRVGIVQDGVGGGGVSIWAKTISYRSIRL